MAVWSIVQKSELSPDFRLDAEYYRPEVLSLRKSIEQSPFPKARLEEVSSSIINFGAYSLCNDIRFQDSGVRFITAENIHDGYIELASCRHISRGQHETLLWKSQVTTGQVLVAMAARLGFAAVYEESDILNSSQDIAKVTLADTDVTDPFYMAAYINSSFGRGQLLAAQTGSVQQHTNLGKIKELIVVLPPVETQRRIGVIFRDSVAARQRGLQVLAEAESLLVTALRLDKLDLTPRLSYERNYKDTVDAGRLDAEYFQPAKWQVLATLTRMPGRTVGEQFRSVRSLWQPDQTPKDSFVRNYDLTDALSPFLDETHEATAAGEIGSTKKRLQAGDLVISRLRSYLKEVAIVSPSGNLPMVGSTEFIVLRPNQDAVCVEALLVYLRSPSVQTVLKWCQDGSNHPRFDEREVLRLRIPTAVEDVQDDLAALEPVSQPNLS